MPAGPKCFFEQVDGHVLAFIPVHQVGAYFTLYQVTHGLRAINERFSDTLNSMVYR
jgi:hypothetical protein